MFGDVSRIQGVSDYFGRWIGDFGLDIGYFNIPMRWESLVCVGECHLGLSWPDVDVEKAKFLCPVQMWSRQISFPCVVGPIVYCIISSIFIRLPFARCLGSVSFV